MRPRVAKTVVNDTADLGVARRLQHLPEILSKARDVNRRMVDAFRVGQGCVLASPAWDVNRLVAEPRAEFPSARERRAAASTSLSGPRDQPLRMVGGPQPCGS